MALWISCCDCVRSDFHRETPFQIPSVTLRRQRLAVLSELPKDTAAHRLASLIERLPGGRLAPGDSESNCW